MLFQKSPVNPSIKKKNLRDLNVYYEYGSIRAKVKTSKEAVPKVGSLKFPRAWCLSYFSQLCWKCCSFCEKSNDRGGIPRVSQNNFFCSKIPFAFLSVHWMTHLTHGLGGLNALTLDNFFWRRGHGPSSIPATPVFGISIKTAVFLIEFRKNYLDNIPGHQ